MFIEKVVGYKMRYRNDKDTAEKSTPQVNNAKPIKTKSTLKKYIIFKDSVAILPHSLFCILSHQIAPYSTLNGYNSTVLENTSNCTFKICIVTISIAKNNNNAMAVGKAVNALMKIIHGQQGQNSTMEK